MQRLIVLVVLCVAALTGCSHGGGIAWTRGHQVQQAPPAKPVSPPCVFTPPGC